MNNQLSVKHDYTPRPKSHKELRAFLKLIDIAIATQNANMVDSLNDLSGLVEPDSDLPIRHYMIGASERIHEKDEMYYRTVDDEELAADREELNKVAYGDFNEAMRALENDLNRYPYDNLESDVFDAKYFKGQDRLIWDELRPIAQKLTVDDLMNESDRSIDKLRKYQEKAYGPQIPVIYSIYSKGQTGFTARYNFVDGRMEMIVMEPHRKKFEEYYANNPIKSAKDFNINNLPKEIDGFKLDSYLKFGLFRWEL